MPQQFFNPQLLSSQNPNIINPSRQDLIQSLSQYAHPVNGKAIWQLSNTLIPYAGLWGLMIFFQLQGYPYWSTLLLTIPASALLVRIFIFFHDCSHSAYLPSRKANCVLGNITGFLTFTPFEDWQRTHIIHHSAAGNLDRRGVGDIWTLTVAEYKAAAKLKRFVYRLFRNPLVLFGLIPIVLFLIVQRFPSTGAGQRERFSVHFTNAALLIFILVLSLTFGFQNYLMIQLPIIFMAAGTGMWLFYVQHQYENVYWRRQQHWDMTLAGLEGSSYYQMPKIVQWIVGNIGLHHIHHLRANIPNYNLQRCYNEIAAMQNISPLTIRTSLKSLWLNLWDEERNKLVSFNAIKNSR